MPVYGTLDVTAGLGDRAMVPDLSSPAMTFDDARILQFVYEIAPTDPLALLPPALHPTNPPLVYFQLIDVRDSEIGSFRLLTTRIASRAGTRLRGFLTGALVDGEEARGVLDGRWGFGAKPASIKLHPYLDVIRCTAEVDGRPVFDASLIDPEPISGGDLMYVASAHLARTADGPTLLQVDPEFVFRKADRGKPHLALATPEAMGTDAIHPVWAVSASYTSVELTFCELRFASDPTVPALIGTVAVGADE